MVLKTPLEQTHGAWHDIIVGVLELMISGDHVSPHQITHIEVFEFLIKGKVDDGVLQDLFSGRIRLTPSPHRMPITGKAPPDLGMGVGPMSIVNMGRIIGRDVIKVLDIVARHWRGTLGIPMKSLNQKVVLTK